MSSYAVNLMTVCIGFYTEISVCRTLMCEKWKSLVAFCCRVFCCWYSSHATTPTYRRSSLLRTHLNVCLILSEMKATVMEVRNSFCYNHVLCESKKSPNFFWHFFQNGWKLLVQILHAYSTFLLLIFIQLPASLTKLHHIKLDHHYMLKMSTIGWNACWVVALNMT